MKKSKDVNKASNILEKEPERSQIKNKWFFIEANSFKFQRIHAENSLSKFGKLNIINCVSYC